MMLVSSLPSLLIVGNTDMACLKATDNSESHYSKDLGGPTGAIALVTQATQGNIQFAPQCSVKDQNGKVVNFKLQNNNQALQFNAAQGMKYTLLLIFVFLPSTSLGFLTEQCPGTDLNLPIVNGSFISLVIAC